MSNIAAVPSLVPGRNGNTALGGGRTPDNQQLLGTGGGDLLVGDPGQGHNLRLATATTATFAGAAFASWWEGGVGGVRR